MFRAEALQVEQTGNIQWESTGGGLTHVFTNAVRHSNRLSYCVSSDTSCVRCPLENSWYLICVCLQCLLQSLSSGIDKKTDSKAQ